MGSGGDLSSLHGNGCEDSSSCWGWGMWSPTKARLKKVRTGGASCTSTQLSQHSWYPQLQPSRPHSPGRNPPKAAPNPPIPSAASRPQEPHPAQDLSSLGSSVGPGATPGSPSVGVNPLLLPNGFFGIEPSSGTDLG